MTEEKGFVMKVHECRLTRDVATFGSMDPYVIINISGRTFKSKIAKNGGKNPRFTD